LPALREIVSRADPQIPVSDVKTMSDIVRDDTAPRRDQARALGALTAAALALAALGIHGLLSFSVSSRLREIGVRVAMGAQPRDILRMVLGRAAVLTGVGVGLGIVLAYVAGRALQALLAGVSPADLATFAAAVAVSLATALLGSLLPALRAVRVDPMTVIRSE
jgi:putative ABC transport system permease protein